MNQSQMLPVPTLQQPFPDNNQVSRHEQPEALQQPLGNFNHPETPEPLENCQEQSMSCADQPNRHEPQQPYLSRVERHEPPVVLQHHSSKIEGLMEIEETEQNNQDELQEAQQHHLSTVEQSKNTEAEEYNPMYWQLELFPEPSYLYEELNPPPPEFDLSELLKNPAIQDQFEQSKECSEHRVLIQSATF